MYSLLTAPERIENKARKLRAEYLKSFFSRQRTR